MSAFEQRLLALAGHSGGAPRQADRVLLGLLGELAAAGADRPDAVALDTLGMRNQRLLRLHRQHCGPRLEACARCPACAEQIEFDVPTEAVLGLPPTAADAFVEIGNARLRLPRIADLVRLEQETADEPVPLRLARLCLIEGAPRLDAALLARLGEAFDQADPAANIALALSCSECGADFPVAVDVAPLVADAFARLADRLLRDIDTIASAYGWGEDAVLALPRERMRQYVALIAGRRRPGGARPQAVVRSA